MDNDLPEVVITPDGPLSGIENQGGVLRKNGQVMGEVPLVRVYPEAEILMAGRGIATAAGKRMVATAVEESAPKMGGRLGNAATRNQIDEISTTLKDRGYKIVGGGGREPEEYLQPLNGGRKGGSYLDITATHPRYGTLRINTVDTYVNSSPTNRELINATRIRQQIGPGNHLLLIPKSK